MSEKETDMSSNSSLKDSERVFDNSLKTDGCVQLTIANVSKLHLEVPSSDEIFLKLPWRMEADCAIMSNDIRYLNLYLYCNTESESTIWSCEASVTLKLYSQRDHGVDYTKTFFHKFDYNNQNYDFLEFCDWDVFMDPDNDYVKDDRAIIDAVIVVQRLTGIRPNPVFDFTKPFINFSNVVLLIGDVRLHVNKEYLALYSPVFEALFFGEYRNSETEIPLNDCDVIEFVDLLRVIYPSRKAIDTDNVEYLLRLADKYEVQYVMNECENFLIECNDIPVIKKLLWSDQYQLANLQDTSVRTFNTVSDIRNLQTMEDYKQFSDGVKAGLFEKMLQLLWKCS